MSLLDVQHQPNAQRMMQRAIARQRIPHAYIFHGPEGVGKELLAHGLAELLLCANPVEKRGENGDVVRVGCGACDDCRAMRAGTHPDWHLVYRQLNRDHPDPEVRRRKGLDIGVDVLRHFVIEAVGHTPMRGRAKVFVFREADRITTQAQNALLKTLEEPPGTTFVILLVSSLERLLATTLSRCQLVSFDTLPVAFIRSELARRKPDLPAGQLEWYARVGSGSVGAALEAVSDELHAVNARLLDALGGFGLEDHKRGNRPVRRMNDAGALKLWTDLAGELGNRYRKRDPDITDTEAARRGFKTLFQLAAGWFDDLLHVRITAVAGNTSENVDDAPPIDAGLFAQPSARRTSPRSQHALVVRNVDRLPALQNMAEAGRHQQAIEAIKRLAEAERQLDLNANTQLVVETLLNDLAAIASGTFQPV